MKAEDITQTLNDWNATQCIIKTSRFGYDGKGQIFHKDGADATESWTSLNTDEAIIEGVIDFDYEVSVIIARDTQGGVAIYPPTKNEHKNHILDKTHYPSPLSNAQINQAEEVAKNIADAVGLVGVMALELFVTKSGELLANEIAPRTHNSGHWTIDACAISQFENHVRCACDLPVGAPAPHSHAVMHNLIGDDIKRLNEYYAMDSAHVHMYGKTESRQGRKMGHVTILKT
jgi:5-(carboxyamino)imidazole ribonucleotide synthase